MAPQRLLSLCYGQRPTQVTQSEAVVQNLSFEIGFHVPDKERIFNRSELHDKNELCRTFDMRVSGCFQ